jgi:hypothetical protein
VKTSAKTAIFVLLSTAVAFAESPKLLGAWSIYPANNDHVVLLQSTSSVQGQPAQAKLDVICRNGKLCAIALEPSAAIQKSRLSFTGVVPNTRVAFSSEGQANQSEPWAVMDDEHTRSPCQKSLKASSNDVGPSASPAQRSWAGRGFVVCGMQLLILIGAKTFPIKTQEAGQASANAPAS